MMEIHSTYVCEKTFDFLGIFIYLDSCWWGKEGWARKVGQGRLGKEGGARKQLSIRLFDTETIAILILGPFCLY